MHRRQFLQGSLAISGLLVTTETGTGADVASKPGGDGPFDATTVRRIAAELVSRPFQPPVTKLPESLSRIGYDEYRISSFGPPCRSGVARSCRSRRSSSTAAFSTRTSRHLRGERWQGDPGRLQSRPVRIRPATPAPSRGHRLRWLSHPCTDQSRRLLRRGARLPRRELFSGARQGQRYGLSARGLAIDTGLLWRARSFRVFTEFWLERPAPGARHRSRYSCVARIRSASWEPSLHAAARQGHRVRR